MLNFIGVKRVIRVGTIQGFVNLSEMRGGILFELAAAVRMHQQIIIVVTIVSFKAHEAGALKPEYLPVVGWDALVHMWLQ